MAIYHPIMNTTSLMVAVTLNPDSLPIFILISMSVVLHLVGVSVIFHLYRRNYSNYRDAIHDRLQRLGRTTAGYENMISLALERVARDMLADTTSRGERRRGQQ